MYEFIKAGKGKSESLRQAQLWLKDPANRQEQLGILNKTANQKAIMADRRRFSVDSVDSDEITEDFLPDDLSWAGFICSGAD